MLGKDVFVIFLSLYVTRNFRGTCSSIKMLKGYMPRVSLGTPALYDPHGLDDKATLLFDLRQDKRTNRNFQL